MSLLRSLVSLSILSIALAIGARATDDPSGGGGGGGITILPGQRQAVLMADYQQLGIGLSLPAANTRTIATILLPGVRLPAASFLGGSQIWLPGPDLAALWQSGVREFTVKISTITGWEFFVDVDLESATHAIIVVH